MEYIELGPVPAGESCAQVGTDNYLANSMLECGVYRRMLARVFPIPEGLPVKYVGRSHPHDFGPYREVSIGFAGGNQAAVDFAYQIESALPESWDVVAFSELAWFRRRDEYFKAVREGALPGEGVPRLYATNSVPHLPSTAKERDLLPAYPL